MKSFGLTIVTQEEPIYEGFATKLFVTSVQGELEILYGHARLLAELVPAPVWIETPDQTKEAIVMLGGLLEVQPEKCIILADTAIRAADLDEAKAMNAKLEAKHLLSQKHLTNVDYALVKGELAFARAQLKVLRYLLGKNT